MVSKTLSREFPELNADVPKIFARVILGTKSPVNGLVKIGSGLLLLRTILIAVSDRQSNGGGEADRPSQAVGEPQDLGVL